MAQLAGGSGGGAGAFGTTGGTYIAAGVSLADGGSHALLLDSVGNLRVNTGALVSTSDSVLSIPQRPTTATVSRPAATTNASATILALNASRWGASVYNEGAATGFVKLGATASTTSYWTQVPAGAYYPIPFGYTGVVDAITSAGTAQFEVVEFTA